MGRKLVCALCTREPRLSVPIPCAWLAVLHAVVDHGLPLERFAQPHRMPLVGGGAAWGLGSRGRKRGQFTVWRVEADGGRRRE